MGKSRKQKDIAPQKVGKNLVKNHKCSKLEDWQNPPGWFESVSSMFENVFQKDLRTHFLKFVKQDVICEMCPKTIMYCDCCGMYTNYCQQCWGLIDFVHRHPAHKNPVCEECFSK